MTLQVNVRGIGRAQRSPLKAFHTLSFDFKVERSTRSAQIETSTYILKEENIRCSDPEKIKNTWTRGHVHYNLAVCCLLRSRLDFELSGSLAINHVGCRLEALASVRIRAHRRMLDAS